MLSAYLILFGAIVLEVIGTVALKYSVGLTRVVPLLVVVAAYGLSFWLFALALRVLPLGTTTAILAGLAAVGSVIFGMLLFGERLNWIEIIGIVMIVSGTVFLALFSGSGEYA